MTSNLLGRIGHGLFQLCQKRAHLAHPHPLIRELTKLRQSVRGDFALARNLGAASILLTPPRGHRLFLDPL